MSGWPLHFMILKIFTNLSGSMILRNSLPEFLVFQSKYVYNYTVAVHSTENIWNTLQIEKHSEIKCFYAFQEFQKDDERAYIALV